MRLKNKKIKNYFFNNGVHKNTVHVPGLNAGTEPGDYMGMGQNQKKTIR
jgi:hypothetical protein